MVYAINPERLAVEQQHLIASGQLARFALRRDDAPPIDAVNEQLAVVPVEQTRLAPRHRHGENLNPNVGLGRQVTTTMVIQKTRSEKPLHPHNQGSARRQIGRRFRPR